MVSYDVLSKDNKYFLDPNKNISLLLQSVENTLKGTAVENQIYDGINLLNHEEGLTGKENKKEVYHNSFLDMLMGSNIMPQKKYIRISCGIISVRGNK